MVIVGIVGGVASGKSLVTEQLRKFGAVIIDADRIGHKVLEKADVKTDLHKTWGAKVFDEHGLVCRKKLAACVFGTTKNVRSELEKLERITHPHISAHLQDCIANLKKEDKVDVVVLDAAIMFKTGWNNFCDKILFVKADDPVRMNRAQSQRDWSSTEFNTREASQTPIKEKLLRADAVIDNNGTIEQTCWQIKQFYESLNIERS